MTKEELATERNEVREILEDFSEELSQSNLDKLSRVFCIINGDEKRIAELETQIENYKLSENEAKEIIAELKEDNSEWEKASDKWKSVYELTNNQLSKAKEIIKTMLSSKTDFDERRFALWAWKEEVNKAEQFLSEVEK